MIKQILEKLFCKHDWKELQVIPHEAVNKNGITEYTYKYTFIYACKKCGEIRRIDVSND